LNVRLILACFSCVAKTVTAQRVFDYLTGS